MGYVKTPEELAQIAEMMKAGRYQIEELVVEFTTTTAFLESVLPPGLTAPDDPVGFVNVCRWRSHRSGDFHSAAVYVPAVHGETRGGIALSMPCEGDTPVLYGREMWGEVKKPAKIDISVVGDIVYAYAERMGEKIIEIAAQVGPDSGPSLHEVDSFEVKAQFDAYGRGLQYMPELICLRAQEQIQTNREGAGFIKLTGSLHDPVDTVPMVSVDKAIYRTGASTWKTIWTAPLPLANKDDYLPYLFGRYYDNFLAQNAWDAAAPEPPKAEAVSPA